MSNKFSKFSTIKYDLPKGYYITNIDELNWGVVQDMVTKKGKPYRKIIGYYSTLPLALRGGLKLLSFRSSDNQDLENIVERMEKLSNDLLNEHEKKIGSGKTWGEVSTEMP